ncbi:hypothetical protein ACIRL0_02245 [Streptomyces sp. NPDC102365]|uniref:hypothetical protein n=1 Tax=Streptomyces sp. NPDC102365 TaxID=3366162 RepID=UPI003806748D
MVEGDDPALSLAVRGEGGHVAVGESAQLAENVGEVGGQRPDDGAFAEVPHTDEVPGAAVEDQRVGEGGEDGCARVDVEPGVTVDLGLLPGAQIDVDDPGVLAVAVGADPGARAVRGELEGLQVQWVVRAGKGDDAAHGARLRFPTGQFDVPVLTQSVSVHRAVGCVHQGAGGAGVPGEHREFAGGDVEFVEVEHRRVTVVEVQDRTAGPAGGQIESDDPSAGEGGEVDGIAVRVVEVDAVEVVVLVPVAVLFVQQPARVVGPVVAQDAAPGVGGDASGLSLAVEILDPDVEPVTPGSQVGELRAVG